MALTVSEQELYDFARGSVPRLFFQQERSEEEILALVKIFDAARASIELLFQQAFIGTATDLPPDFLGQIARDEGTGRLDGESDAVLRARLRSGEDAVTPGVIEQVVQDVLDEEGIVGAPAFVELRVDRAYMRDRTADTGVGGTFSGTAPDMEFEPDVRFLRGLRRITTGDVGAQRLEVGQITFAGSNSAGNDGTFDITGVVENRIQYTNGSGVAEVDGGTAWTNEAKDDDGNVIDGHKAAYMSRGYRMGSTSFIVILPFGCNDGTVASVAEAVRTKKVFGAPFIVECNLTP